MLTALYWITTSPSPFISHSSLVTIPHPNHKAYQKNIVVSSDATNPCQKPPTQFFQGISDKTHISDQFSQI